MSILFLILKIIGILILIPIVLLLILLIFPICYQIEGDFDGKSPKAQVKVSWAVIFLRAKEMMPRVVDVVDKLMNGRILLSAMNLAYYPVTLIGQKVDLSLIALDNQYYALDNGFVYILIHYGILGSLIIAGFQQKAIMKCIEKKDVVLTTICILILFWMVYEGMMVSATSNFTLLFASTLIGTDKLKQKE